MPFFLYPECRIALPNLIKMKSELREFHPDAYDGDVPFLRKLEPRQADIKRSRDVNEIGMEFAEF